MRVRWSFVPLWFRLGFRWLVGLCAALLGWWSASVPPDGVSPATRLALSPCHLESLAEEVLCGVHEVYENRETSSGRRIGIHVAVLPALRRSSTPDPLYILAGGPGQGARSYAPLVTRHFRQVRRTRAIVLVDLRGTGGSNALNCLRQADELEELGRSAESDLGDAEQCLAEIDADPRHYTHASALADLDEVRQRLGHARINLWGGSWGTRAALLYALGYPRAVRSLVLDGAVSLHEAFPGGVARNADRALSQLFDRCARDRACASTFPDPRRELKTVLERLDRSPVTVSVAHPRTARPVPLTLTRNEVEEIIRVALYTTVDAARLPDLIRRAARGDFAPLVAQYVHSASLTTDDMALGATMSILCSEDVSSTGEDAGAGSRGGTFGSGYVSAWRSRCRVWPKGPPIAVDRQATSAAPALILSGEHDPVTPPSSGEAMGRHFPNHVHVVVPGAAHNVSFTGCLPDVIARFLENGGGPLETTCVADAPLPPMVLGEAGGRP